MDFTISIICLCELCVMRQMKEILYTISLKRETYPIESIYTDVVILLLVPDLMVINIE